MSVKRRIKYILNTVMSLNPGLAACQCTNELTKCNKALTKCNEALTKPYHGLIEITL